ADVRVVSLTVNAFHVAPRGAIDFDSVRAAHEYACLLATFSLYGQSKLAALLMETEIATRDPEITGVIVHPHRSRSNLMNNLAGWKRALIWVGSISDIMTSKVGSLTQVWAAVAPGVENGTCCEEAPG
ncbi:hypothetical protein BJ878DRAFT_422104, partial [Calycina marina]